MPAAPGFWYKPHSFLGRALSPLSFLYHGVIATRRWLYKAGIKKITKFPVPIIIAGNITVGGSGKTPLVIWLANQLKKRGFKPGLVSRGYGGRAKKSPQIVTVASDPRMVGDEAILLVAKTDCPMVVGADRPAAVKQLLQDFHCDMVISDDGLQHYSLGRDIEIVIMDDDRHWGNGLCLPAGPLREPKSRLNTVDFVITKQLCPLEIYQLKNPEKKISFGELMGKTVHAVAALGNPKSFFYQLESLGVNVIAHPFPDHYFYRKEDFYFGDDLLIIMSEKDAVKCKKFNDERLFCLSVDLEVPDQFQKEFFQRLETVIPSLKARHPGMEAGM